MVCPCKFGILASPMRGISSAICAHLKTEVRPLAETAAAPSVARVARREASADSAEARTTVWARPARTEPVLTAGAMRVAFVLRTETREETRLVSIVSEFCGQTRRRGEGDHLMNYRKQRSKLYFYVGCKRRIATRPRCNTVCMPQTLPSAGAPRFPYASHSLRPLPPALRCNFLLLFESNPQQLIVRHVTEALDPPKH